MECHAAALSIRSYAKVNLCLDVLGRRPDGLHDIESVMQTVGLHDTLTIAVTQEPGIRLTCNLPLIPLGERNFAHRAVTLLLERIGPLQGLEIHIEKRIPPEAGLGGGSSNVAAVLRGVDFLLKTGLSDDELCKLAAEVSSDAPFFLVGGRALVSGRGEIVRPLPDLSPWDMVIVKPSFGVSTPWAYRRLDEMRGKQTTGGETRSSRMTRIIAEESYSDLPALMGNDLETPAMEQHPEIAEIKEALIRVGAVGALMCGSGSAVFGLFETEKTARDARESLTAYGEAIVTRTVGRESIEFPLI